MTCGLLRRFHYRDIIEDGARPLGGTELDVPTEEDPRKLLVDWMVRPDNPYFAGNFVNRVWPGTSILSRTRISTQRQKMTLGLTWE